MATSVIRALQLAALLVLANIAQAAVDPPPAYKQIALPKGVPAEVLYSVALTESKVLLRGEYVPWPWTLNVAGKSYYYATRTAACTALLAAINLYGAKSVDSGLGQVNIGWNGHRFSSPCDSLDPYKNLDATSDILIEQRDACMHPPREDRWTGSKLPAATTAPPAARLPPNTVGRYPATLAKSSASTYW